MRKVSQEFKDIIEVDALITQRIVLFYNAMVEHGQIAQFDAESPSATHQPDHCNRLAYRHSGGQPEGLVPLQADSSQPSLCEREHE